MMIYFLKAKEESEYHEQVGHREYLAKGRDLMREWQASE